MKKRIFTVFCSMALIGMLASCSTNVAPENSTEPSTIDTSSSLVETSDGRYTEETFPLGTPEEQEIVTKYIDPYSVTWLFGTQFSAEDMANIDEDLLSSMFLALNMTNGEDYPVIQGEAGTAPRIAAEFYETFLGYYFNLTPKEIKEKSPTIYDAESDTYQEGGGLGGGPARFVITDFSRDGNILTFSYDYYGPSENANDSEFHYELYMQGTMIIDEADESGGFKFISNTSKEV